MTKEQRPTLKEYVDEVYNVEHCTNAGLIGIISEYLEDSKEASYDFLEPHKEPAEEENEIK